MTILIDDPKHIPDDLLLPWQQSETLPGPAAFRMLQVLNKPDSTVSAILIVMGSRQHELRRNANIPSLHGFLEIIIIPEMDFLLGYLNPCTVFFISRIKINAGYAAAVVALQAVVDLVLLMRHDPQVF